jgi:hypothetical protein
MEESNTTGNKKVKIVGKTTRKKKRIARKEEKRVI